MKFLIVLAVAVACVAAADELRSPAEYVRRPDEYVKNSADYLAPIVRSDYQISPEGETFNYVYETGNGISAQADGNVKNFNSDSPALEMRGSYRYPNPDGTYVETTWVADENGFIAKGTHIPQIPEAIARSLAYFAANPPQVTPGERVYGKP